MAAPAYIDSVLDQRTKLFTIFLWRKIFHKSCLKINAIFIPLKFRKWKKDINLIVLVHALYCSGWQTALRCAPLSWSWDVLSIQFFIAVFRHSQLRCASDFYYSEIYNRLITLHALAFVNETKEIPNFDRFYLFEFRLQPASRNIS